MLVRRVEAAANNGANKRVSSRLLRFGPRLQTGNLGLQVFILLPSTHSPKSTGNRPSDLPTNRSISDRGIRISCLTQTT